MLPQEAHVMPITIRVAAHLHGAKHCFKSEELTRIVLYLLEVEFCLPKQRIDPCSRSSIRLC